MKKVILIPGNTDLNRGDQALVWESVRLIEDVYDGNVEIQLLAAGDNEKEIELQVRQTRKLGKKFLVPILGHPGRHFKKKDSDSTHYTLKTKVLWIIQALWDLSWSLLLISKVRILNNIVYKCLNTEKKTAIDSFKQADAVFVKGGGFIHSYGSFTDVYFVYYLLFQVMLAQRYGKDVFVFPNSFGPFRNKWAKSIVRRVLKKCKWVSARESISSNAVKNELELDICKYPDLGFYLKPSEKDFTDYLLQKGVPLNKQRTVALTLRPYRFHGHSNPEVYYNNYKNAIVGFVKQLVADGFHITFFAHTLGPSSHEDDRIALKDVLDILPADIKTHTTYIEDFELDCQEVEKIYSYYDYIVGTRFHSVIFSLNVSTPALAIAYGGNKGKGIMEDLDINQFVIDMDNLSASKLISMFNELVATRSDYLSKLNTNKAIIDNKRHELVSTIKQMI